MPRFMLCMSLRSSPPKVLGASYLHFTMHTTVSCLPDGYPTATEDPAEIEETARSGTVEGGDTGSGQEHQEWVPLPFGKNLLF